MKRYITLTLAFSLLGAAGLNAADLTMTFTLKDFKNVGFKPAPVNVTKDQQFCGRKTPLVDESVVINPENGGVQNVVVFLYVPFGQQAPASTIEPKKIEISNKACRYEPHIISLTTKDTLLITNPDPVGHNTKIDTFVNPAQNFNLPAGAELEHQFGQTESLPTPVSCSIHPWMKAFLVIKDHPFVGVSDKDGKLTIKDIPVDKEYTYRVWQEKAGYLRDVDGLDVDKKGRFTVSKNQTKFEVEVLPEAFE